tara:strand:- start:99715 stop:99897 length:183 start_codon:yes stop_codon:yes gene_type:complete
MAVAEVGLGDVGGSNSTDQFTGGDTSFGGNITFAPKGTDYTPMILVGVALVAFMYMRAKK